MPRNHVGERFGSLTVVSLDRAVKRKARGLIRFWKCLCDCGNEHVVSGNHLRGGSVASCGCRRNTLHRMSTTHRYEMQTWRNMLGRCNNPKHVKYHLYGACGVKVCDRWLVFENFVEDMGRRPQGKTIDRYPNNNGNYEPGNCRWATALEQRHNRRDSGVVISNVTHARE